MRSGGANPSLSMGRLKTPTQMTPGTPSARSRRDRIADTTARQDNHEGDVPRQIGPWQLNISDPFSSPPCPARELQSLRARCVLLSLCSSRAAPGGGGTARLWLSAGANQSWSTAKASVPRFGHVRACRDATGWDLPSTGARFTPQPPRRRWVWSVASVPLGVVNPSRWTAECGSMKGR